MVLGSAMGLMYRGARLIGPFCRRKFTVSVEIRDPDVFRWFEEWLANHTYGRRCRKLNVSLGQDTGEEGNQPLLVFSPGRGYHLFRYDKRFFWLSRSKDEDSSGSSKDQSLERLMRKEYFSIQTWGRNPESVKSLLQRARELAKKRMEGKVSVYYNTKWGDWRRVSASKGRSLDSVVLGPGIKTKLVKDVKRFLDSEEWYGDMGIPYRRGYLFYGPPGNGKTSITKAIAAHLKMDLYVISLASSGLSDEALMQAMNDTNPRSIIVIEDVDSVFENRKSTEDKKSSLSFSGLLNAIDGVASQEGRILVMTTNHIERLDPALIREGRADVKEYFGNAGKDQIRELFVRFFPDEYTLAEEFVSVLPENTVSAAALQNHFLTHRDSAREAVANVELLLSQNTDHGSNT